MNSTLLPALARLTGVDLARGLAVCTMILAHTSPWPIDLPAEYLTAPLFALLIGMGLQLAWSARPPSAGAGSFIVENAARGLILVVLGEVLQRTYHQIDIVLQTLGVLTIVLAPLVVLLAERPLAAWAGSAAMLAFSPTLMTATREFVLARPEMDPTLRALLGWLAAGFHYRLTSHLVFGLGGVALAYWLRQGRLAGTAAPVWTSIAAVVTLGCYGLGRATGRATAYSGDHLELAGSLAFAAGAVCACVWLVAVLGERAGVLQPFVATGRLALSAYTLQVLYLAALNRIGGPAWDDDQPWVLGSTLVVVVAGCWLWRRLGLPGPLEALLRLPRGMLTVRPAR